MFNFFKSKFKKISEKLKKISIGNKLKNLFSKKIDEDLFFELEKLFYESDLGAKLSIELSEKIKEIIKKNPNFKFEDIIEIIKKDLLNEIVKEDEKTIKKPHVIMVVGVNGAGKTTSIAKLANYYKSQNKKVLIAAADTYRAAAVDQIDIWAKKLNIDIVKSTQGSDPAACVFDAITSATKKDIDIVIIDTAGRLHTKIDLMQELNKISRVSKKVISDAPHETILVLDATTGQNALDQAKIFNSYAPITSIFLTKLDGTAKGGIVISIQKELKIPIKFVGIGEKADDIEIFDPTAFIETLLSIS
ncbi:MAG: Signal recognition particle receptor FtsY [Candidatus Anoxychlamydiales bacterium]|nr:Signal recognition particle receptor FtsY [Candidatus Anoxychlamydiales bacterium]